MSRPLVAILRGVTPDAVEAIGDALLSAGISRIEVPMNSPDPIRSIALLVKRFGDQAQIGGGTMLTPQVVDQVADVGGALMVSPNCDPEVIGRAVERGMTALPGVFTATECFAALKAGAQGLKFFPASQLGAAGLKALKAVLPPEVETYAVGGVDHPDFAEWLAAGVTGFGLGTALYKPGRSAADVGERAGAIVAAFDAAVRSGRP